jgi:hypothetical protein
MSYIGICLKCEEEKIRAMLGQARQISYEAERRAISPSVLDKWALSVDCALNADPQRLQLKGNPAVTFYRSRYDVLPCVYIVHERVRHIFVEDR